MPDPIYVGLFTNGDAPGNGPGCAPNNTVVFDNVSFLCSAPGSASNTPTRTRTRTPSPTPLSNVNGTWQECGPDTVGNFSAVGYFFGRDLQKALGVPVGLIHSSWGGTVAEAWTPRALSDLTASRAKLAGLLWCRHLL